MAAIDEQIMSIRLSVIISICAKAVRQAQKHFELSVVYGEVIRNRCDTLHHV